MEQTHVDEFNEIFNKYEQCKDKFESLYIFVIHDLIIEDVLEKIKKMLIIIDQISSNAKKSYLSNRIKNFQSYLEGIKENTQINNIFMISNKIDSVTLKNKWKETLKYFDCDNFLVKYDNNYQISWLRDLLLDYSYTHILHFRNNDLKHYHFNSTKKKLHKTYSSKSMNVIDYINENTNKGEYCIVHGISSFLRSLSDSITLKVLNGDKKDDEILDILDKFKNEQNIQELSEWMNKFNDPKDGKLIVFGKDIGICMKNKILKTLYCSEDFQKKVFNVVPKEDIIFEMKIVKSYGNDIGKKLIDDFKGAIGIKFY